MTRQIMGSKLENFTTAKDEEEASKEFFTMERQDIGCNIEDGTLWK